MADVYENEMLPEDPNREGFSWTNPGQYGVPGWEEGESPVPAVLDQYTNELCIAYSSRNVIQTGVNKAAMEKGIPASQISLEQLQDCLEDLNNTPKDRNLEEFLNTLLITDLVAMEDYDNAMKSPHEGAATYEIEDWLGLDQELDGFALRVKKGIIHRGAAVGELKVKEGFGHVVCFVGWVYKPWGRNGKREAWKFQNSYRLSWAMADLVHVTTIRFIGSISFS